MLLAAVGAFLFLTFELNHTMRSSSQLVVSEQRLHETSSALKELRSKFEQTKVSEINRCWLALYHF